MRVQLEGSHQIPTRRHNYGAVGLSGKIDHLLKERGVVGDAVTFGCGLFYVDFARLI